MNYIFVNLKRFDVNKKLGGICLSGDPKLWIEDIIKDTVESGLGEISDINLIYMLPEGLIISALNILNKYNKKQRQNISIGCQGVHMENIRKGGNFGAFTTFKPAAAVKNIGAEWVVIGHSEERRYLENIFSIYDENAANEKYENTVQAVNSIINKEVLCALESGLNILLCVGETSLEKGNGSIDEQMKNVEKVLSRQVRDGLKNIKEAKKDCKIVFAYEPVWAIGPGKTPPDADYIKEVGELIKKSVKGYLDEYYPVIYGGGLKEDNAKEIAGIDLIDGGFIGLTKFTDPIGFNVNELKTIIEKYREAEKFN